MFHRSLEFTTMFVLHCTIVKAQWQQESKLTFKIFCQSNSAIAQQHTATHCNTLQHTATLLQIALLHWQKFSKVKIALFYRALLQKGPTN